MKHLFILRKDPDPLIRAMITQSSKEAETIVVDLREDQDYEVLVDYIETCDKVITC